MASVSIGICAFNEEANIGKLLESLVIQELKDLEILEIIVVSSNSTDNTDNIVREYAKKDHRISLMIEKERKGKTSAVNLFLKSAKGDICVIQSADTIAIPTTIQEICMPILTDEKVGGVAGRPIPKKGNNMFVSTLTGLIWELNSRVSKKQPKLGEISAHRNVINEIPAHALADDAYLEFLIIDSGYRIVYSHDAIIFNTGPDSLSEFIKQRVRWRASQISLRRETGHISASGKQWLVNFELIKMCLGKPWVIPAVIPLCVIEMICIRKARKSLSMNEDQFLIWEPIKSTKDLKD